MYGVPVGVVIRLVVGILRVFVGVLHKKQQPALFLKQIVAAILERRVHIYAVHRVAVEVPQSLVFHLGGVGLSGVEGPSEVVVGCNVVVSRLCHARPAVEHAPAVFPENVHAVRVDTLHQRVSVPQLHAVAVGRKKPALQYSLVCSVGAFEDNGLNVQNAIAADAFVIKQIVIAFHHQLCRVGHILVVLSACPQPSRQQQSQNNRCLFHNCYIYL